MALAPREIGTLIVVVLKAKNLPNKRHIGKQAPYCCAFLNEEKRRTKAIKRGGQHPEWDEEFRFTVYEATDDELNSQSSDTPPPPPPKKGRPKKIKGGNSMRLQCYADDPREPDLIGEAVVDLTEVLTKGETDEWFTLMYKDKYAGEVYIELTFWSNEPPPGKRNAPKAAAGNINYGGPGNFVPANGSTPSLNGSSAHSTPSRLSVSSSTLDSHLPSTIRSSHSRAELYAPAYEQWSRVSPSPADQLANDFGELGVMDPRRRESFPPAQTIRPSTSAGFSSLPLQPHAHDQHTLDNGTLATSHDGVRAATTLPSRIPSGPVPYYPPYENGSTTNHPPPPPSRQGHAGPRYSLPASSSGFKPIPSPSTSSFGTMTTYPSEQSGFLAQERPPLPIPPSYPPAPVNYSPPHQIGHPSLPPLPPPHVTTVPPPNASHQISHSYSTPQLHSHDKYQYSDPHGPTVAFPSQEYIPSTSGPQTYHTYAPTTPSPPHDYASTSQHIPVSRGSRPLPQPQMANNAPRTRHLSVAVPPSSSFPQSLNARSPIPSNFPNGSAYQNTPPPPPLPTQYHSTAQPHSGHPSPQGDPQNPGAASYALFPTSPAQPHSNVSPVRPSLPQPPMGYHPVQPAYQPLPQPPPPQPDLSRHGQLHPPPSLLVNAPPANHSYFPGPPPRPPQMIDHSHWGQQGNYGQPAPTQGDWQ
ncbi:hypothetical protein DEU56DRAFT_147649 [Suillus clintonianus]|uniref:uncharacterized protein n=1 Tax=Suillus clintonianus TaxID=1904413 RepID=UPI001B86DC1A|nr:uncharacterized protein DEU56DRAFT_147649 [Suillus clintonianus]KAG2146635.1 hypothetical protein DEU56DRAFT_147649 [Suillus clintonianus]